MLFARREPEPLSSRVRGVLWPRRSWKRSLRYMGKRVLRLRASPHAIAAGFGVGVLSSFTPFLGFHILLALALAFLIRGNMAAAALGTAVGNPLTFPLIWGSTYEAGRWILHNETVDVARPESLGASLMKLDFAAMWKPLVEPMLVGSLPLGLLFGAVGYVVVFLAARSMRDRRADPAPLGTREAAR